jgi:hypothetical protein
LWKRYLRSFAQPRPARRAERPRLRCEALEDRLAPAIAKVHDLGTAEAFAGRGMTSLTLTVGAGGVAAGDAVILEMAMSPQKGAVSVTDTAGNSYHADVDVFRLGLGVGVRTLIFSSAGVKPLRAGDRIVISFPQVHAAAASATEYSGIDPVNPLDRTAKNYSTGAGTKKPSSGFTDPTSQADELLIGAIGVAHSPADTFTAGSGYTLLPNAGTSQLHKVHDDDWSDDSGDECNDDNGRGNGKGNGKSNGHDDDGHVCDDDDERKERDCESRGVAHNITIDPEYRIVSAIGKYQADGTLAYAEPWSAAIATYRAKSSAVPVATHFSVTAPANATAGAAFSYTVTALSASNQVVPGYMGTITLTTSDANGTLSPLTYTFTSADAGSHTFTNGATLKTAGAQTITAKDSANAGINGSATIQVAAAAATRFSVSAPATATAGVGFSFTVTAFDAFNNVATGYGGTVKFSTSDGQGTVPAASTLTSGVGTFSATLKTAGNQTLTATDTGNANITGSATVKVNAAAATHFSVSAPATATAGSAFSFTVTALDQFNNTATGYSGTVKFGSSDGIATLPANSTLSNGVGTFSATLKTAGNQTLTATDTGNANITGSATVKVNAAAATHFSVSAPASATAGVAFSFTVTALDQFNNTATTYGGYVAFSSSDSQAVLPGVTFMANGVGTYSATLKTAGNQSLTASDNTNTNITGSATVQVNAAAAAALTVTAPATTTAGAFFTSTVTAVDAFGNRVSGFTGTVQFNSSDGIASLPGDYTFTAGDAGQHAFTNGVSLRTAGSQSITATSGSLTGSATSLVTASAGTHFSLGGYPSPTTAGDSHLITLTVTDAFGNIATGYTGTVFFQSTDGQAVLPANYTFTSGDAGVHGFPVTLKTVGTQSIKATSTVTPNLTSTQSGIVVVAGATAAFKITPSPTSTVPGVAVGFTVAAFDAYGNATPTYQGKVGFTSSDSGATLPVPYQFAAGDSGSHFFAAGATFTAPGKQTIVATDLSDNSITGTGIVGVVGDHYDFNSGGSPTAAGYVGVLPTDAYSNGLGYGWSAGVTGFDRGTPNALLQDGNSNTSATDFIVDHPNGQYVVKVVMGDATTDRNGMSVGIGGNTILSNLSVPAGQFLSKLFATTVTNGQIDVRFNGANWAVNALDIYPGTPNVLTIVGPSGAAAADGTSIDTYVGSGAIPGDLVTITTTLGSIVTGDADPNYAGVQVVADGNGNFLFTLKRPSSGSKTIVSAEEVFGIGQGSTTRYFIIPDEWHFDFGTNASPVAGGYTGVLPTTAYDPSSVYGWAFGVTGFSRSGPNALLQDGNFEAVGNFLTDLPVGAYSVTVTMGDATFPHVSMHVDANGTPVVASLDTAAGQFAQRTFTVNVTGTVNGQLSLALSDLLGANLWALNSLDIRPTARVGAITLTGPGDIVADNSTTATITGHSSLPAGSLVTVTSSLGSIVSADADPNYDGVQVTTAADGSFTFQVRGSWASGVPVLTATSIDQPGPVALSGAVSDASILRFTPAAVRRFDFNSGSSPTATGFIGVLASDLFSSGLGYGWAVAPSSYDRGATNSAVTKDFYRDGHFGTIAEGSRTFSVQVTPGGAYSVRFYIGDPGAPIPPMNLTVEGTGTVQSSLVNQDTYTSLIITGSDTNNDGVLKITVQATNGYWGLPGLDVAAGAAGNLPGAVPQQAGQPRPAGSTAPALTADQLAPIAAEAVHRWELSGITPAQAALLHSVQYRIEDLSAAGALGLTGLGQTVVRLDATAAGRGWFIDTTPGADEEFSPIGLHEEAASAGSAAAGHYDLLTVIEHELGHVLGLDDLDAASAAHDLMALTLDPGIRRTVGSASPAATTLLPPEAVTMAAVPATPPVAAVVQSAIQVPVVPVNAPAAFASLPPVQTVTIPAFDDATWFGISLN